MPLTDATATDHLNAIAHIVGVRHVIVDASEKAPYLREWRDVYQGKARAVVRPGSTAEVSELLAYCNAHRIALVPQGGNTGLVGGALPMGDGNEIILNMTRMNAVRAVDPASNAMTVEAGVTLLAAQEAAAKAARLFPLSLAAEGSCTIGGNLSTNAGGVAVLAYGNMRDLTLGLEVVLADGRVWNGLSMLRKDNTGYDLRNIFIGAEGTLGIITAATLKLFTQPRDQVAAFLGVPSPQDALALLALARGIAGDGAVTAFELIPRIGIDWVLKHAPQTRDPLPTPHRWYVLMELSGHRAEGLEEMADAIFTEAMERGLMDDGARALSLDQRAAFWKLRESLPTAQVPEGASVKHDVSVPVQHIPAFIADADKAVADFMPEARVVAFGHVGDGNVHYNVSRPLSMSDADFMARWDGMYEVVHGAVLRHGGSISAEHGIGRFKRDWLKRVKDPVALEMMRMMKAQFDPNGILNPGAVL
ncbi:MAG: FAD-binding oxidoreductase [Beijerinckiaceae bacterium]